MTNVNISNLTVKERDTAYQKYQLIEPYLNNSCSLKSISKKSSIPLRTLSSWVEKYKRDGLLALARQIRKNKGEFRRLNQDVIKITEALYLKYPASSYANIYRLLLNYCEQNKIILPSYRSICKIISLIPNDLATLSHFGSKAYKQKYDLLYIREADRPNQIWQADHVLMDIEVLNHNNKLQRPWLTIIIDDCSRAICGYELSFLYPSANKTSLCLRQAIWRKSDSQWSVFGVPEIFYTAKMIIIDESERLKSDTFELIREIYDSGKANFIFIGMPGIEKIMARFPQLYSRIGFVHQFKHMGNQELKFILENHLSKLNYSCKDDDYSDQEVISTILRITNGNFRLVDRVIKQSMRIMKVNYMTTITKEIVEAARSCLLIGEK